MIFFDVWALAVVLYIGHGMPFCKKCTVETIFNTHTHTQIHFMGRVL